MSRYCFFCTVVGFVVVWESLVWLVFVNWDLSEPNTTPADVYVCPWTGLQVKGHEDSPHQMQRRKLKPLVSAAGFFHFLSTMLSCWGE